MVKLKKYLLALMAIGAAAYFAGGGTFASFSGETSNVGSTVSSGTLTMSDQVDTGSICFTSGGAVGTPANNVNPACPAVLTLANVAPGTFAGSAKVTLTNNGSIDAANLFLYAPTVNTTLTGSVSGAGVTSLPVTALPGAIRAGEHIVLTSGANTQTVTAASAASPGAVAISIPSTTMNATYPTGSTVVDTDDCNDKLTTGGTNGLTKGDNINFASAAGYPLCGALNLFVQETTNGQNYCWVGHGSSPQTTPGLCYAPISVATGAQLTHGVSYSQIDVSPALNGNVMNGDSIVVRSGSTIATFTARADAPIGSSTILVTAQTTGQATFDFPVGSTVTDTSSLGVLNSSWPDAITLTNFDTAHNVTVGKLPLSPVVSSGNLDVPTNNVQLGHGASRTFYVGVYLRNPLGSNQNPLQGLQSTFGLTWHIDQ